MPDEFDEDSFWEKVRRFAGSAGREVIEKALWLFYAAQSPNTPDWAKSVIYAALAYFVLPIDAIPDLIPLAGFTDDLGALTAAVTSVALFIDDEVKERARKQMVTWFGPSDDKPE